MVDCGRQLRILPTKLLNDLICCVAFFVDGSFFSIFICIIHFIFLAFGLNRQQEKKNVDA